MAVTSIKLSTKTRDLLKSLGAKGETYDAIIRRLAREYADRRLPGPG